MQTYDKSFSEYYFNYLGINQENSNEGKVILKCEQRDKPLNNKYSQHLIITRIGEKNIFSITPKYYEEFKKHMSNYKDTDYEELHAIVFKFFSKQLCNYSIRKMYRLTVSEKNLRSIENNEAIKITKDMLMDALSYMTEEEKQKVWLRKRQEIEQGRQFSIINDKNMNSYCKVSDIYCNGGNLTVWTAPEFRSRGYAKQVVEKATRWCFENNVVPIYWVDSTNIPSLNLARSLGFEIKSEEIVISMEMKI